MYGAYQKCISGTFDLNTLHYLIVGMEQIIVMEQNFPIFNKRNGSNKGVMEEFLPIFTT